MESFPLEHLAHQSVPLDSNLDLEEKTLNLEIEGQIPCGNLKEDNSKQSLLGALERDKRFSSFSLNPADVDIETGTTIEIREHMRPRLVYTTPVPSAANSRTEFETAQALLSESSFFLQSEVLAGNIELRKRTVLERGPGPFLLNPAHRRNEKQTLVFWRPSDATHSAVNKVYLDVIPRASANFNYHASRGGNVMARWWRHPWTTEPSSTPPDRKLIIAAMLTAILQVLMLILPFVLAVPYEADAFAGQFVWTYFFGVIFSLTIFVPTMAMLCVVQKEGPRRFFVSYAVFALYVWGNVAIMLASWFAATAPLFIRWGMGEGWEAWT